MSGMPVKRFFRLLVVEDDSDRVDLFRKWVGDDAIIVWAKSAGSALGLIRRDPGRVYGAIMLDHDLQQQAMTEDDQSLSGTDVTRLLIQYISVDVPVLVHSANQVQALNVVRQLEHSGFWVERIPMQILTETSFRTWFDETYEIWQSFE